MTRRQKKRGKRDDLYYINTNNIEQVNTYGKASKYTEETSINLNDVFVLHKKAENDVTTYIIKYFNQEGNEEEVGILELANPLIK